TYIPKSNPSTDTITAVGHDFLNVEDPQNSFVTCQKSCTVNIPCNPKIAVTKQCTVVKNADGTYTVNYNGTVSNTGDVTLTGVTVQDDKGGAPISIGTLFPAGSPVGNSSAPYSGSYTLPATTPCNTDVSDNVTARGTYDSLCLAQADGTKTVSATAPA